MIEHDAIADVQGRDDHRQIPINKVGVKGIRHPIYVTTRSGEIP
ncbi:MAG TPA: GTP cyclohydrolase, FolE2/MptA family, partial [Gammaproteobacteria bacterium]|nr:GTP cyclohydrolase, FolE2/MptA family [Gammaproteobacteria bacterium]